MPARRDGPGETTLLGVERSSAPWLDCGFVVLREEGHAGLTIDRLCKRLGKTKGSFYHHFESAEAYAEALLARWEEVATLAPIEASRTGKSPRERATQLDRVVRGLDHAVDQAIRGWASRDERARRMLARIDARRIAYLTELHAAAGHPAPAELATLEYAVLLGAQQLHHDLASEPAQALQRTLRRALKRLVERAPPRGIHSGD